jgi:transcriptional regulator with XRE-family HTH domain
VDTRTKVTVAVRSLVLLVGPSILGDEEGLIHPFRDALGSALRAARTQSGMSLRDVQQSTRGRLKASAVGAYERGERDLSVSRLVQLAAAYHVRPDDLLRAAMTRLHADAYRELTIDLRRLSRVRDPSASVVAAYAKTVKDERRDYFADVLTVRAGDLEVLAGRAHLEPTELLAHLGDAVVRVGGEALRPAAPGTPAPSRDGNGA